MTCKHNKNHRVEAKIACFENVENGFMAEIRIFCGDCGHPFQFQGLEPGIDTHGARVSIDGLEANIAIFPDGARPSPLRRMAFNVKKFDG